MEITNREVLAYLRPNGGYVAVGKDYEGITFEDHCEPFTKAEYLAAFDIVKELKENAESQKTAALAKLEALGLTTDDLKALGLG